jgi:hypothetical protein
MTTKTEFREWQSQEVTKNYFNAVRERIEQVKEELILAPITGVEARQGYVRALLDILDVDFLEES